MTLGISRQLRYGLGGLVMTIAAVPAHAGTVELWRDATVTGDVVQLGDVCTLTGLDELAMNRALSLDVATAPAVGESDVVSMASIRKALTGSGFNPATTVFNGATTCKVNRIVKTIPDTTESKPASHQIEPRSTATGRTLRQVIEADLNEEADRFGGWVQVTFGRAAGSMLDMREGEYEFEVRRRNGKRLGMVSLDVIVYANGEQVQEVGVVADVSFVKPTVVAVRPINLNATISERDVKLVNMTYKRFEQSGIDVTHAVVGQKAKRFIDVGSIVHDRNLAPVPLVKRGQIVQVHSRSGGVVIESVGRVMKAGAYGDVVELQTADRAKRKFTAVVSGPGLVSVGPLDARLHGSTTHLALGGEK